MSEWWVNVSKSRILNEEKLNEIGFSVGLPQADEYSSVDQLVALKMIGIYATKDADKRKFWTEHYISKAIEYPLDIPEGHQIPPQYYR